MKKQLTEDEIWGVESKLKPSDVKMKPGKVEFFGFDICGECKHEIPRREGLKTKCPKCKAILRNPPM